MLIYGAIAAVGVLLLLSMLLVGELFGGDHDVSAHDVAVGEADHGGGPNIFSTRIMAAFLTAFGVGGVVARFYNLSHPAASGVGTLVGVAMSGLVYQFARILYAQQASSELTMTGLVGTAAHVSVAIPAGGLGQVAVSARGQSSEHIARSADGQAVARGAEVIVTGVRGDAVIVTRAGSQPSGGSR
jgi:membrane protein implicated in regulation of membrane protease activity